jgi:hypothetical protein
MDDDTKCGYATAHIYLWAWWGGILLGEAVR